MNSKDGEERPGELNLACMLALVIQLDRAKFTQEGMASLIAAWALLHARQFRHGRARRARRALCVTHGRRAPPMRPAHAPNGLAHSPPPLQRPRPSHPTRASSTSRVARTDPSHLVLAGRDTPAPTAASAARSCTPSGRCSAQLCSCCVPPPPLRRGAARRRGMRGGVARAVGLAARGSSA